jgi:hypothetical protein
MVLFLDSGLSGMPGLFTFTGDAVNSRCFQARVIVGGPKEADDLPRLEAYNFDVMS